MPIRCHFQDCKTLLVTSLTHVNSAIASTRLLPFPLPVSMIGAVFTDCEILNDWYAWQLAVCWCAVTVMCHKQHKLSCAELGRHRAVRHGRSPGRLLDVAATFWSTGEGRPFFAQGGEMLAEDNVPLNARVPDVIDSCHVASGNDRHLVTGSTVDDCCHSWKEAEKYVSAFAVFFSEELFSLICFYASAQRSVAGGIMFLSCSSVRASVCAPRNIVNTICCRVFDTFSPNLHQRCFTIWYQGHGRITYAGNSTFWLC